MGTGVKRKGLVVVGAFAALAAGCSSGSSSGSSQAGGTSPQPQVTVTITHTATAPAGTTGASPTASATPGPVSNLFLTPAVRQQLIDARAAVDGFKPSEFTGLAKGNAYYALDNTTGIHWAAAATIPSSSSERAQVASQDDGGYFLFEQPSGGAWKAYSDGLGGTEGSTCPVTIPAGVLAVWHWTPGTCFPPNP
jgi:beta-N-acetylhexosaminidase